MLLLVLYPHIQFTSDYIQTRAMEMVGGMQPTEQSFLNLYIHSSSVQTPRKNGLVSQVEFVGLVCAF